MWRSARITLLLMPAFSGVAAAQVATALVRTGSPVSGGAPDAIVTGVGNVATNRVGGYAVYLVTNTPGGAVSMIWGANEGGPGAIIRTESTIGPHIQSSFESFFGISNHMDVAYSALLGTGGPAGFRDSVWLDDRPILVGGEAVQSIPGQFWRFGSRPGITADGKLYWVGGVSPDPGGFTGGSGLFMNATQDVLLLSGDSIPGLPAPLTAAEIATSFNYRFSALGTHYISAVQMTDLPVWQDTAVVFDGAGLMASGALIQEGTPVPPSAGGINGENWFTFGIAGVTERGQYFFAGGTSGPKTLDQYLFMDGHVAIREGDLLDGFQLIDGPKQASMNESGDLAVVWPIAPTGVDGDALFLNGRVVLLAGSRVDLDGDGVHEPNSVLVEFVGVSSLSLGERDATGAVPIYFLAQVDVMGTHNPLDDLVAAFCVQVPAGPPCSTDLNYDGVTDLTDLTGLLSGFGSSGSNVVRTDGDIDGDDAVGLSDLALLISAFGQRCP